MTQHTKTPWFADNAGVYNKDPRKNKDATLYDTLSYQKALEDHLQVMDQSAFSLCQEQGLPIVVFNFLKKGNLLKAARGDKIGTLVKG